MWSCASCVFAHVCVCVRVCVFVCVSISSAMCVHRECRKMKLLSKERFLWKTFHWYFLVIKQHQKKFAVIPQKHQFSLGALEITKGKCNSWKNYVTSTYMPQYEYQQDTFPFLDLGSPQVFLHVLTQEP